MADSDTQDGYTGSSATWQSEPVVLKLEDGQMVGVMVRRCEGKPMANDHRTSLSRLAHVELATVLVRE